MARYQYESLNALLAVKTGRRLRAEYIILQIPDWTWNFRWDTDLHRELPITIAGLGPCYVHDAEQRSTNRHRLRLAFLEHQLGPLGVDGNGRDDGLSGISRSTSERMAALVGNV